MNLNLAAITPPLREEALLLAQFALELADRVFQTNAKLAPAILVPDGNQYDVIAFDEFTPAMKQRAFAIIHALRKQKPVVGFMCEAWTATIPIEEYKAARGMVPPPAERPNRVEVAMVVAYSGERVMQFSAPILRSSERPKLGDWELKNDSGQGQFVMGRMVGAAQEN